MSSSGRVLIVGSKVSSLVERLEARGYACTSKTPVGDGLEEAALASRPDVIVLATPARSTSSTLQRIRKHAALRAVPVLIESRSEPSSKSQPRLEVDGIADSPEALERLIGSSIRARRSTERETLIRSRLELLLEVSRSRKAFHVVAAEAAKRLLSALGCDDVSILVLQGDAPRKAHLIGAKMPSPAPVDLAVTPMLRRALETKEHVESEGQWVYPCGTGAEGVAAFVLKRAEAFDGDECDFLNAVAVALTHALEHEHTQANVAKTRESLEAAYLDRYRELAEANRRLNALDRKKNEMLAVLSHDLRAPLNVLIGHSWMMLDDQKLAPAHRGSAEAIQRTSKKILELVETLLEKSRGEEGHIVLFTKKMDVSETCQEAVTELQILAREKGIALRVEAPMSLMVLGDEQKIRQVLQNLITNALKHAKSATQIVVRARLKPAPSGPLALVEVRDNGVVAAPNDLLLAFERSTGLGLSICRDFVERHGGEIWAEAPESGGASFNFTLPMTRDAATAPLGPTRKTDAPLILLVEDDPVFARVCSLGLSGHYRVEVARDGNEGLERAKQLSPDIIVMDLFMPNRDGLDTLEALQASPQTASIPVVLVSAHPDLGAKLRTLDLGAIDYLTKPFPINTLLTTVSTVLKRSTSATRSGPGNDRETGLLDHVGIANRLDEEMSRSVRYARPLTLVVFKPATPPGEKVRALASVVRSELRSPDVVGHLGNGVLVMIFPETPSDAARPIVERLRGLLQKHGIAYTARLLDVRDDSKTAERVLEQLLS